MKSLSDIKRRLASVKQTRQITGAMETVSIAKMRKASERFDRNNAYYDALSAVMNFAVRSGDSEVQELVAPPDIQKKLIAVISSDKGLCGSFNHDIIKTADAIADGDAVIVPIGRIAYEHFSGTGYQIDDRFVNDASVPDYARAKIIADAFLAEYGKTVGAVKLVYTRMVNHAVWAPTVRDILPLTADDCGVNDAQFSGVEFEPSLCEVSKSLLPLYVGGTVYGALVHSAAAEHGARRAAMSASSKNADEMIAALSAEYNSARQSSVTGQIIDIIGAAQAIGKV